MVGSGLLPLTYLWPWLVANFAYCAFIYSEQGQALVRGVLGEPIRETAVALAVCGTFLVTGIASILASITVKGFSGEYPMKDASQTPISYFQTLLHAGWVVILGAAPGFIFAIATQSNAAMVWLIGCVIAALLLATASLRSIRLRDRRWERIIFFVGNQRLIFAGLLLCLAVSPLALGANFITRNPGGLSEFGPLLVSMIGLFSLATLIGGVFIIVPACLHRPRLGWILVMAMLVHAFVKPMELDGANPLLEAERRIAFDAATSRGCHTNPDYLLSSSVGVKEANAERLGKRPVGYKLPYFIVTAEGGGIRAAYWTAVGLAELDVLTQGKFGSQVGVLSGVSGGSLGVSTWLAARSLPDLAFEERVRIVEDFLSGDFLSPLLGGFLFLDVPRFIGGQLWFSARRDHVFEKAMADRWRDLTKSDFFVRPLHCLAIEKEPLVILNAMDALTGDPIPFSNLSIPFANKRTLVEYIHLSARFPFLSPGAELGVEPEYLERQALTNREKIVDFEKKLKLLFDSNEIRMRAGVVVDGGYYDNSAIASTVSDNDFQEVKIRNLRPARIHFSNNPDSGCVPASPDRIKLLEPRLQNLLGLLGSKYRCSSAIADLERRFQPRPFEWITTPIEALLTSREGHAKAFRENVNLHAHLSVSDELSAAFGESPPDVLATASLYEGQRAQHRDEIKGAKEDAAYFAIRDAKGDATLIRKLKAYISGAGTSQPEVKAYEQRMSCFRQQKFGKPPLGWTLDKVDRELLSCLSRIAAFRADPFFMHRPTEE